MQLFTRESGSGTPIIFLHGLFGQGVNLISVARSLDHEYRCILTDQRNHGNSGHDDFFSYPVLAEDINETLSALGIGKAIIAGHSMGAKIAMEFALSYPEKTLALICMDSAPGKYPPRYQNFIKSMDSLDLLHIKSRREAETLLLDAGVREAEMRFLLKNLRRKEQGFYWRLNLKGLIKNYDRIWDGINGSRVYEKPVLFLKGEFSDFIQKKDESYIRELFPSAQIEVIKNADHWLHVDNPDQCVSEINAFLSDLNLQG